MSLTIKPELDQNRIVLNNGQNEFHLEYTSSENFIGNDTENGFLLQTTDGRNLSDFIAQNQYEAFKQSLARDISLNYGDFETALAAQIKERLLNTDGDANDQINLGNMEAVREAFLQDRIIEFGKGRAAKDIKADDLNNLIAATAMPIFYKTLSEMLVSDDVNVSAREYEEFLKEYRDADINNAKAALANLGLEGDTLAILSKEKAPPSADSTPAPAEPDATEEPEEPPTPPEPVDPLKDIRPPTYSSVIEVQEEFGIYPSNGIYNVATELAVRDYVHNLIEQNAAEYLEDRAGGTKKLIALPALDGKTYEIVRGLDNNNQQTYFFNEIDPATGERAKDAQGTLIQGVELDVRKPHPALTYFMALELEEKETELDRIKTADYEFYALHAEESPEEKEERRLETLEKQKEAARKIFANSPVLNEILKEIDSSDLDAEKLRKSAIIEALKKEQSETDINNFLAIATSLATSYDGYGSELKNASEDYNRGQTVFEMFTFMNSGQGYDPQAHQNALDNTYIRDNFFSLDAYSKIDRLKDGEALPVSDLYNTNNPEQKAAIEAYFGDKTTASRQEIRDYARLRFEIYAIEVLSDAKPKDGATKDELQAFINEHESTLGHISQAMLGEYKQDGKTIFFNPYAKDVDIVFTSFPGPQLGDPDYMRRIDYLRGPNENNFVPDGYDALKSLSRDDQEQLFKDGLAKISEADLMKAAEKIARESGYSRNVTEDFKQSLLRYKADEGLEYARLGNNFKAAFLGAVVQEVRPDMFDNELYARVVNNYYEPYCNDHVPARIGEPTKDANGQLQFDEQGYTQWSDDDSWNGRYGAPHQDLLADYFVRLHGFELNDIFNGDQDAISVFFKENTNNRVRNYDLSYEEIKQKLNAINPQHAQTFENYIKDMDLANSYTYLLTLRKKGQYDPNRDLFVEQEKLRRFPPKPEPTPAPTPSPDGDDSDNPDNSDENTNDGETPEIIITPVDPVADNNLAPEEYSDNIPGEAAKAGPVAAAVRNARAAARAAGPVTNAAKAHISDAYKQASKPNHTIETRNAPDYRPERVTNPSTQPREILRTQLGFTEAQLQAAEKARLINEVRLNNDLSASQKVKLMNEQKSLLKNAGISDSKFKNYQNHKLLINTVDDAAQLAKDVLSAKPQKLSAVLDNYILGRDLYAFQFKKLVTTKPGFLKSAFKAVSSGLFHTAKDFSKGFAKATKWGLVGAVAGAAIGKLEIDAAEDNAKALIELGILPVEAMDDLDEIYNIYLGASGLDVTGVGSEIYLKTTKMAEFIEKYDIDPATAQMIFPDLMIDMASEVNFTQDQIDSLKENYTDANFLSRTELLATKHGLPTEIDGLPIGYYLADENKFDRYYHDSLKSSYNGQHMTYEQTDESRALRTIQSYINTHKNALSSIEQYEEAMSLQSLTIETADHKFELKYSIQEAGWISSTDTEQGFSFLIQDEEGNMVEPFRYENEDNVDIHEEFYKAVTSNKDEIINHMKSLLAKRLEHTDSNSNDRITAEDLEAVRSAYFSWKGPKTDLLRSYAIQALYSAVEEIPEGKIAESDRRAFLQNKDEALGVADKAMQKILENSKKDGRDFLTHREAVIKSPFNNSVQNVTQAPAQDTAELEQTAQTNELTTAAPKV